MTMKTHLRGRQGTNNAEQASLSPVFPVHLREKPHFFVEILFSTIVLKTSQALSFFPFWRIFLQLNAVGNTQLPLTRTPLDTRTRRFVVFFFFPPSRRHKSTLWINESWSHVNSELSSVGSNTFTFHVKSPRSPLLHRCDTKGCHGDGGALTCLPSLV